VVDANAGAGVIVDSSNAAYQVLIRNVDVTNSGTTGAAFQSTGGNTTAPTVTISDSTFKGNGQTADAPGVWFATTYPLTAHIRSTSIFENQYDGLKISNPSIVLTMGAGPINPAWCDPSQSTCTTAVHLHSNDLTWDGGLSGSTKDSAHADLHDARPHNATNPNIEIYAVDFNNAETLTRDTVYGNASATPVREVLPLGALYYGLLMDDGRNKVRTH
jgi:hypothetical protein